MRHPFLNRDVEHEEFLHEDSLDPPNPIISNMYHEITNISQALNIGLLVLILTSQRFYESIVSFSFSTPLFAFASLLIVVIFWTRFYFDTAILNRSYTLFSTFWFFAYTVVVGTNISFIPSPSLWLLTAGILLFFGAGFYATNLVEIRRKQEAGVLPAWTNFARWQSNRMRDLLLMATAAEVAALAVWRYPTFSLPAGILTLLGAIWQATLTADYRKHRFLRTGL